MNTNIYLARHGETVWNQSQRLQGHLDSPLTMLGIEQAHTLAQGLSSRDIDVIVSSPLGRAVSTATICQQALNKPLIIAPMMIERNLGSWQGQLSTQLKQQPFFEEALHQVTDYRIDDGESAVACGNRIVNVLIELSKQHKQANLLIICHGEALRCLLHTLGEVTTGSAFSLHPNGSIVTLAYCHRLNKISREGQADD